MDVLVARAGSLVTLRCDGQPDEQLTAAELPVRVRELEGAQTRWVWADSRSAYPPLLAAGVRVARCVDLRLTHAILRRSAWTSDSEVARAPTGAWDVTPGLDDQDPTLLDDLASADDLDVEELAAEHRRQQAAIAGAAHPERLRLLTTAESVGGLIAVELRHFGLPFDVVEHDRGLTAALGPRPRGGARPERLEGLVVRLRELLGAPGLNPESQPALLRALRAAGIEVTSTRKWELARVDHPAIEVLLEYKKLARLLTANGWVWSDRWVRDGRFRPDYLPAGVVTGRWATQGGGALQIPHQVRGAVRADPGWRLVVADAAQLEPRVLAAMSADEAMASAGRGHDLYAELVTAGVVATRPQAKVAMLGALYGATTGESGALMPALRRAYPRAIGVVETAAREGERGGRVTTWLGRTSPVPGAAWDEVQRQASHPEAGAADERAAGRQARDWGRFTRNFVVQGTAAEWALCWLAAVRRDLAPIGDVGRGPHLCYFLHDELMVHTRQEYAERVAEVIVAAAGEAGRLLFGGFPMEFPVTPVIVESYDAAKDGPTQPRAKTP